MLRDGIRRLDWTPRHVKGVRGRRRRKAGECPWTALTLRTCWHYTLLKAVGAECQIRLLCQSQEGRPSCPPTGLYGRMLEKYPGRASWALGSSKTSAQRDSFCEDTMLGRSLWIPIIFPFTTQMMPFFGVWSASFSFLCPNGTVTCVQTCFVYTVIYACLKGHVFNKPWVSLKGHIVYQFDLDDSELKDWQLLLLCSQVEKIYRTHH